MLPTLVKKQAAKTLIGSEPRILKLRKAPLTLTTAAVSRLKELSSGDHPQFLRVGVKSKGCSGNSYMMEFAETKGKFDEIVNQEGVTVLVDSKALLTVLGSEMDYVEGSLSSQFVFYNPNVKGTCGCGESFTV
ncbi:hypothetical protein BD408DRAFT_392533 [Parasitella parasitica]|nr:hypothetical protein BD408DRAFT_392533 [Parasitella parasitica]